MTASSSREPLRGLPLVLGTLAVTSASFMNTLDTTIAVVAVPNIAGSLAATPSQGSWIITSYAVCLAVILPLSGWITRRFGEVRTFMASVILFTLTSWLCGIADSFNQLILFRALQGFAGGLLLPLSQSLLLRLYPPEKHGLALSLWGLTTVVAPVIGPVLGGYITDNWGWPWIFYINIPIGALCVYLCWTLLRRFESDIQHEPVDLVGLVLLIVGVICFQLMLDRGHELDWLSSIPIRVMLVTSVLCFFLFLAWERGEPHPVVDLSLFRYRSFLVGTVMISVLYTTFLVGTVILPIWMQTTLGYTATWSGIMMSPTGLAPLLLMPLIGQHIQKLNVRIVISAGIMIMILAFFLHAMSSTESPAWYFIMTRLITGLALPFAYMPLMVVSLAGLPPEKMASAAGIFNFTRMLASSLGTAIGITLWDQRAIYHRSRLAEDIAVDSPQYREMLDALLQRLPDTQAALAAIEGAVAAQARTLALDDIYYLCLVIILPLLLSIWFLPVPSTKREAPH